MTSIHAPHYDPNESFQSMADTANPYYSPRSPFLHRQYNEGRRDSLASIQSCAGLSFSSSTDHSSPEALMSGPPTCVQSPIPQERLVEAMGYGADPLQAMPLLEHHRASTPACGTEEPYNGFAMTSHPMSMYTGPLSYTVGSGGLSSAQHPPVTHSMEFMNIHTSGSAWVPRTFNAWSAPEWPFQPMTPAPQETIASGCRVEEYMVPLGYVGEPSPSQLSCSDDGLTLCGFKTSPSPGLSCHPARRSARTQRRPSTQSRKTPTRSKVKKEYSTYAGELPFDTRVEAAAQFVCKMPGCYKRFKRMEHSKRHYVSHTGAIVARCSLPQCGKGFTRNDNFIAHMKTHLPHQKKNKGKNTPFTLGKIIYSLGDNTKVIEKLCLEMGILPEDVVLEPPEGENIK